MRRRSSESTSTLVLASRIPANSSSNALSLVPPFFDTYSCHFQALLDEDYFFLVKVSTFRLSSDICLISSWMTSSLLAYTIAFTLQLINATLVQLNTFMHLRSVKNIKSAVNLPGKKLGISGKVESWSPSWCLALHVTCSCWTLLIDNYMVNISVVWGLIFAIAFSGVFRRDRPKVTLGHR